MKTILVLISIMILGLYSCGDESTNLTPNPTEETKKYTLEEILADTNWVEITDTLHYEDINGYTYLNNNWANNHLIMFKNLEEYKNIERLSDTTYEWYKPNSIKYDINFDTHTLIGTRTETTIVKKSKIIYINEKLKQYQYFVKIFSTIPETRVFVRSFNFVLIPKIDTTYRFYVDTIRVWEN